MRQIVASHKDISPSMQRILDLLRIDAPLSPIEISLQAFVARTTLEGGGYLRKMKEMGLIHVEGWAKNHNGFTTPLYALGAKADCPRPKFQSIDRDSAGMAKIIAVLHEHGKLDYREAAAHAGMSASTVKNSGYMDTLLEQKRIYIAGWRRGANGHYSPQYAAGPGENQNKPALLSRRDIMQRHRQRRRVLSENAVSVKQQLQALIKITPSC